MIENNRKYEKYKPSGVEWLGEIPSHWEVKRLKFIFKEKNERTKTAHEELLSLSKFHGVIPRSEITDKVESANSLIGYKICSKGDLVINKLQAWNGMLDISKYDGLVSPDYSVYVERNVDTIDKAYFKYLFTTSNYISEFKKNSSGIGDGFFRLYTAEFYDIRATFPSLVEQIAIAAYLDRKTAQIDTAIAQKQRMIALLKERQQILIHKAVTQGLDPSVKMKDSGVEWIGEVPEHWEVKRLKYLLDERVERSETGEEPLFMVSQVHGLVVRSEYHEKAEVAQSAVGNKKVYENDLVFNKLKAHLGVFFKSTIKFEGIVSPDYAVYYSKGGINDLKYLELLFRTPAYIKQFICRTTGIVEGLMRLYTGDLFSLEVPVPPLKEQKRILDFIEAATNKISTAIHLKEQEIEKLKEYKSSLINSVVTGKVRVKSDK